MTDAYAQSGVDTAAADRGVAALVEVLRSIDLGRPSRTVSLPGHFAAVMKVAPGLGLALATDGVGSKLSAADTKQWIVEPIEMAAKVKSEKKPPMPKRYDKLPAADLDALVAYMQSLKK